MQLTDAQWARIVPLMPIPRGNCTLPSRQVLEGWLLVTKGRCNWRALAERFGPWHTVYLRGRRWIDKGVLERVFAELQRVELEVQVPQREPDRPGLRGRCDTRTGRRTRLGVRHAAKVKSAPSLATEACGLLRA